MDKIQIIGLAASIFTALSMLPQLWKLIKTKETEATSPITTGILLMGCALWVVYGLLKEDIIIVLSNALSLTISTALAFLRLYYKKKEGDS